MGEGVCRKKKLFTRKGRVELESLKRGRWASSRRQELLTMLDQLEASLKELDQGSGQASGTESVGGASDDASRRGSGNFAGVCVDSRPGEALRAEQASGELLGTESARAFFGWTPTIGIDLQARQSYDAFVAGGSRPQRSAFGSRASAGSLAAQATSWKWSSEGRNGQKIGGTDVLDAALPGQLCAAGSHAR